MKRFSMLLAAIVTLAMLSAGCADYWSDQGQAAKTSAQARLASSEASVTAAEGQAALDQAQAAALGDLAEKNTEIAQQALDAALADDSTGAWVAALAMAFVALGAVTVIAVAALRNAGHNGQYGRGVVIDAPAMRGLTIETPAGKLLLPQEPGETRQAYLLRARNMAELLDARGGRLIDRP